MALFTGLPLQAVDFGGNPVRSGHGHVFGHGRGQVFGGRWRPDGEVVTGAAFGARVVSVLGGGGVGVGAGAAGTLFFPFRLGIHFQGKLAFFRGDGHLGLTHIIPNPDCGRG